MKSPPPPPGPLDSPAQPAWRQGAQPRTEPPNAARFEGDVTLARDTLRGRPEAVADFVNRMRCVPRLIAAQNARLGRPLDEHDLADLVQDTLVIVWTKLEHYAGRGSLETWVYRISRLELFNSMRRKKRGPRLVDDLSTPAQDAPDTPTAADLEDHERLYRSLQRLRPVEAVIMRHKHFDQLTFEEIATTLAISTNTAKTRYYRALRKLRQLLGEPGAKEPL